MIRALLSRLLDALLGPWDTRHANALNASEDEL